MHENTERKVIYLAWGLAAATTILACIAWGAGLAWRFGNLSTYKLFPLFGIIAFSLMWVHYIMGAVRRRAGVEKRALKHYFEVTSLVVLVCILLHPGLLIWQLWRDGFGLPPSSYLDNYVSPNATWAVLLGTLGLVMFLSFELHRWFSTRSWWQYIEKGSDIAMVLIFIHALRLGKALQPGWFRVVWYMYGISLAVAFYVIYTSKRKA